MYKRQNVTIVTAAHPKKQDLRRRGIQFNRPVHIEDNVWIGAGSIVTKDIPANVVAVGNPCRVLREIGERDNEYFYKDLKIDIE